MLNRYNRPIVIGPNMRRSDKRRLARLVSKSMRMKISPEEAIRLLSGDNPVLRPADSEWDTARLDLPLTVVDESNVPGGGKKGTSSHTFSMTSATIPEPRPVREYFERIHPGISEYRLADEPKNKDLSDEERYEMLDVLDENGVKYHGVVVYKNDPNLPERYNPRNGKRLYRSTMTDLFDMTFADSEYERQNVYIDGHTAIRGDAGVLIARRSGVRNGVELDDVRQLRSRDEPILMIHDTPTGELGKHYEDDSSNVFKRMEQRLRVKEIGKRQT